LKFGIACYIKVKLGFAAMGVAVVGVGVFEFA
jgi:hypothetical protein